MENFYELEGLTFRLDRDSVLKSINCFSDSPVYEDVLETYEEIYEDMLALVEPVGILGFGTMPASVATKEYPEGTPIVYAVTSIGDGIKQCSTKGFQEGDYVKGMLCDAIADEILFSMEENWIHSLREACAEHGVGITARLEAPHDISMESQRAAWEYLELERRFGIRISSGYMFDPVKTSCQVFILTEDADAFRAEHDCRKCPNVKCRRRNIPDTEVTVRHEGRTDTVFVKDGESLLDALIRENYYVNAVCGGRGHCGKCRIRVIEGEVPVSDEDRVVFSEAELQDGWRLSCRIRPLEKLAISFEQRDEEDFEVLAAHPEGGSGEAAAEGENGLSDGTAQESGYDIAVDIGTTTIALELVGRDSGRSVHTVTAINGQRVYGADVISRIQASTEGKKKALQDSIRKDLQTGIRRLLAEAGVVREKVGKIIVSGNTTMGHLLMGYDCDSLGVFPFTPVNIDFIDGTEKEILGEGSGDAQTVVLPGISTYVGGDIVSGLYACGFDQSEEVCMLVDLGTNGEMALGNKDRILVTSTAAGPAFEGGNITWGTGSIPGAICSVKVENETAQIRTIRDEKPVGICGTGVVETTSELVKEEIVSDTGILDEEYFEGGFPLARTEDGREIVFTQKDIREIQLAKAAIRAGAETLLLRYGVEKEDVARVYLAGGFGYKLDTEKAISIGMLPPEFSGSIEAVGNSSLAGAVKYLSDPEARKTLTHLVEISEEIGLSTDKDFNEFYMDAMFFEEE